MMKFGVAVARGPLEKVPMTRFSVENGSTALHVAADALACTTPVFDVQKLLLQN